MKIIERLHRAHFDWRVRSILRTPKVSPGPLDITLLSMVQHKDVLPYLLALKSITRFLAPARVVVVADPTLDAGDRALLRGHVPHIQFHEAAEFRRPGLPVGGCWERLSAIAEYSARSYVVQLDADTVAVTHPTDVCRAISDQVSFTLGTEDNQAISSTAMAAALAISRLDGNDQIQALAESVLDRLDPQQQYRYVRGCAGFAGFARGTLNPAQLLAVSQKMAELLPGRWSAWGTEQFTSNLLVASSPGARVLPHPRYCAPHRRTAETVFLHFIGYVRYASSMYANTTAQVVSEMRLANANRGD